MVEPIKEDFVAASAAAEAPAAPEIEESKDAPSAPSNDEEEKKVTELEEGEDLSKVFVKLDAGVPSDIIKGLCMDCQKSEGETRFMYTKIPFFKEIIISSFLCSDEECGFRNNEVQFGGKLGDFGCRYKLVVADQDGLNRSIVKSEFATIKIPELDFEIPP